MYYTLDEMRKKNIAPLEYLNYMQDKCSCGSLLLRNEKLTRTICSNPWCPVHMSYRAARMLKYLGINGFAEKSCEALIRKEHFTSHFEVLGYLTESKPQLYLWEIAKLACIENYDTECEKVFGKYKSFEEYFKMTPMIPSEIFDKKRELINAQQYFEILDPLSGDELEVMIHGSIPGFRNRKDYIAYLNRHCGKFVHIIEKGCGQSRSFCITVEPNSGHKKIVTAKRCDIPIVSPKVFEQIVLHMIEKKLYAMKFDKEEKLE